MKIVYGVIAIVWGVWLWLSFTPSMASQRGWGVAVSTFSLMLFLLLLSRKGEGIARTFTMLMGFGYGAHFLGDLLYQVYPPADTLGFADTWYYVSYALFIAAGVVGLLFLAELTKRSVTLQFIYSAVFGLLISGLYYLVFGQATWREATDNIARFTYLLDVLLVGMSSAIGYLFFTLARRSWGGMYAQLFILPAAGLSFAVIADMVFAARRSLDLYQPGDSSDWIRLLGQSLILLFIALAD